MRLIWLTLVTGMMPAMTGTVDSLLANAVQEIIHDIVVKEHLRGQKFAARFDLFLQMQNVLGLVRRLYMTLRIACAADAEIAL